MKVCQVKYSYEYKSICTLTEVVLFPECGGRVSFHAVIQQLNAALLQVEHQGQAGGDLLAQHMEDKDFFKKKKINSG